MFLLLFLTPPTSAFSCKYFGIFGFSICTECCYCASWISPEFERHPITGRLLDMYIFNMDANVIFYSSHM